MVLETKGSYMRPLEARLIDEDATLCEELLLTSQLKPNDALFHDHFKKFHNLL